MKKLSVIMVLCCFLAAFSANAQKKATISFDRTQHDYGKIKEIEGTKTTVFNFTNIGDDTLRILSVRPGCGCTSVNWTKTPVAPGGKGFVNVTYDPKNRPGPFSKGIEIASNDPDHPSITLVVNGDVEPRPRTIADDYPNALGNLRTDKGQVSFQNIPNTETRTDTLKIYNEGVKTMTIQAQNLPAHLSVKIQPESLKPKQKGIILISYDAKLKNEFGFVYDQLMLNTNDSVQMQKVIQLNANIIEDFSKMTPEQLANAPKISFETPTYDFGTVQEGVTVAYDYVFTNNGKDDLYIRKVKGG